MHVLKVTREQSTLDARPLITGGHTTLDARPLITRGWINHEWIDFRDVHGEMLIQYRKTHHQWGISFHVDGRVRDFPPQSLNLHDAA
jgi:hypothetical protein